LQVVFNGADFFEEGQNENANTVNVSAADSEEEDSNHTEFVENTLAMVQARILTLLLRWPSH